MPSKTDRQKRAMAAAAAGKSTIGIPQEVGKEFAKADGTIPQKAKATPPERPSAPKKKRKAPVLSSYRY